MLLRRTGTITRKIGTRTMSNSGNVANIPFSTLFAMQKTNQEKMLSDGMYNAFKSKGTDTVPADDTKLMSYHIQQLMSEIGEVLDADKRWKNFRNQKYDKDAKLEEIADCFIVMMNIAMFSGFDGSEVVDAIRKKLNDVSDRIFDK